MNTRIVYFDESGDDGLIKKSSDTFVLTSFSMEANDWQYNYDLIKHCRKELKNEYGLFTSQEIHTKHFLTDKSPYREYKWSKDIRLDILRKYSSIIGSLYGEFITVIIDKDKVDREDYDVLGKALTYNIQRIENSSKSNWNYILVTDKGRITPMRRTARAIRIYNPIESMFDNSSYNKPIKNMVEDIFEKDSEESYFIQICDFVAYFTHLYYQCFEKGKSLPNRVAQLISTEQVKGLLNYWKDKGILNLNANTTNEYGLVIYPK